MDVQQCDEHFFSKQAEVWRIVSPEAPRPTSKKVNRQHKGDDYC